MPATPGTCIIAGMTIRDATTADAAACAAVYAPYVLHTAISFETDPPSEAEMARRIAAANRTHAWLVLCEDDNVIGYAYGGPHHERAAYRWSCEVSVYVAQGNHRTGAGRALYGVLLPRLAARGFRVALAGMTLPNEASAGLHAALGFQPAGTYRRVGWKQGRWHDVAWIQRDIGLDDTEPPAEPT